jgi:hypothetical protein
MQTYSQQVGNLLKRFVGKSDVLNEDYRQMTLETTKANLKFDKVRGSVRMLNKNVKTEKDFDLYFNSVIETPLP